MLFNEAVKVIFSSTPAPYNKEQWEQELDHEMIIDPDFVEKLLLRDFSLSPEYIVASSLYSKDAAKTNEHKFERSDKIEWIKFMIKCVKFHDKDHDQLKILRRILERETVSNFKKRKMSQASNTQTTSTTTMTTTSEIKSIVAKHLKACNFSRVESVSNNRILISLVFPP